jgi:type II secretory pathway pseudopilin PulG
MSAWKTQSFRRRKSASGFTVLEILVAAALSVVILSVAVGLSTNVLKNWNRATADLNRDAQLRYAEEQWRRDLEQGVVTTTQDRPWMEAVALQSGGWSLRWLTPTSEGLSLVEWTALPYDYNGDPSALGFSLFRFEERGGWEATYGADGALGTALPSDSNADWWEPFVAGNIITTTLELGVMENNQPVTVFESGLAGQESFPYEGTQLYPKPDYIKLELRALSDDKLREYISLTQNARASLDLPLWLDQNAVRVVLNFNVLTD